MKRVIWFYALVLTISLTAVSACSYNTANSNAATNTTANTNANAPANTEPAGTPVAAGGESQASAAEALVADLYKQHDAKKSPFFQTKNRALVGKYFTNRLADLIWKDATSSNGEVGAIDGDPLYNAQDMEIKNFAIGRADVKGGTATVPVTFTNFGQKQTITFSLKQINTGWKIDDIGFGGGDSLMKWLKDTYNSKPDTASNEFAGRYQVGDTTCTVKPVKMAFEVRWAKGSGVEMFFSKDSTTFESSTDAAKTNRFVFDDESYSTGTLYRADGQTFEVKRIK